MGVFKNFDIINDALAYLNSKKCVSYFLPAFLALLSGLYTYLSGKDLIGFDGVVEPIGIFSALMFSVLFIVVEHYLLRKEKLSNSRNEEDIHYLKRYKVFTRDTVAVISFSILIACFVIFLALLLPQINVTKAWCLAIRSFVYSFFIIQYVVIILLVVKEMYAMLTDDIES